jgi:IS5 family transposase
MFPIRKYGKKTRREQFLEEMDKVVPWAEPGALVGPHYPKGENGRPPMGLGIMLRIHFLQQWFNLSDPAAEEALYDSAVLRRFAGVDGAGAGAGRDHHPAVPAFSGEARSGPCWTR